MTYTDENAKARAEFIATLPVSYSATFVPQSSSRNADGAKMLNWRVVLTSKVDGRKRLATDYSQGIAHIPGYRHNLRNVLYYEELRNAWNDACENGRYPVDPIIEHRHEQGTRYDVRAVLSYKPLPSPSLEEVLYSLVMEAPARDTTFEEFCDEYGYSDDSRKAEAMYNACVDIGRKLVRLIGADALARLTDLYQGF